MIYLLMAISVAVLLLGIRIYHFLDGRHIIRDMWDARCLARRSLRAWDKVWACNERESDIVVCLSTIPSRIHHMEDTLKSLMAQTRRPQQIRLHIPVFSKREQAPYTIPAWLLGLRSVEIIRCEDYGPATKLISALQEFPGDQRILVVDDDRLYYAGMVHDFNRWSSDFPDMAIAASGWIVPEDLTDKPTTLWSNIRQIAPVPIKSTRIKKRCRVDIMQGYSGYLIRPRFFDLDRITDYSGAPEAAFYVDDVWISAHCNAPKYVLPAARFCFVSRKKQKYFSRTSLGRLNRGGGDHERRNNTIMIRYFKDRWLLNGEDETA